MGDGVEKVAPDAVIDDVSLIEYVFSGTHEGPLDAYPASGRRIEVVACSIIDARDGRIARDHDDYDVMVSMSHVGALDDAGTA